MRTAMCLNGEWDFMPLYGQQAGFGLPAELVYEERKVQVPSSWRGAYERQPGISFGEIRRHDYAPYELYGYPKEWARAEAGVLHRTFRVPPSMEGSRIFLRFDGVMQKAAVYLDRRMVALWEDGYLPLLAEITEWVKPGAEQELHVVCGNFDKVTLPSGQQKITGLAGSWFGSMARGLWQDVYLECRPELSLADVTIRTSVRKSRLEVEASVVSSGRGPSSEGPYRAILRVREDGRPAAPPLLQAEVPVQEDEGNSGEEHSGRVSFRLDWGDAKLWSPDQPFLYRLELLLLDGARVIDRVEEKFGFREIWTEGPLFMLNGIPLRLRGDSWHFQGGIQMTPEYVRSWYGMCKEAGVNCVRLHAEPHPAYYLDIADEMGMLIVDETAIYGSSKSMAADHPDFIANCRAHVRRLVERDRNHPSVILWSLQNEMRWVDGRDGFKHHIPPMMSLIRELDPTRPIIVEGDNRLLPKEQTEVESRHYNIDGTIDQWDRSLPLVFGEHGGWWYVCPQNSSMYMGLDAYRNTDECVKGLAEKERLFVEYARRQGVTGISTFNFAHYFMRAMPEQDIPLPPADLGTPGPKPRVIPKYSLTLHNGLLPAEYPAYRKNPSFDRMAASFKPATMITAEYNRSFFDDQPIIRRFDVYNDTLQAHRTRIECEIRQEGRLVHRERFEFRQEPADHRVVALSWMPEPVAADADRSELHLQAVMFHEDEQVHELDLHYKLYPSRCKTDPLAVSRPVAYVGGEQDYQVLNTLVPGCKRIGLDRIAELPPHHLLVAGSRLEDADGSLGKSLQDYVRQGGRLLLLEQLHLSLGDLAITRQDFIRAHAGSYTHPVLQGLDNDDLMFWQEEVREEGPAPIIRAAFEKPIMGDFTMLLECSAGDFGDGGDLWTPLLEYRSGSGLFIANQLELIDHFHRVPAACLLLRNLLAYAGSVETSSVRTAAFVEPGGTAEIFLRSLGLPFETMADAKDMANRSTEEPCGLLIVEPQCLLARPEAASALSEYARSGGTIVVLPADPGHEALLSGLLQSPVTIREHETYHLEADYAIPAVQGFSPVDLFGYDKVFLSPRDVVNRPLASCSLEAAGAAALCTSVEGTAWMDYFVHGHTAEYSRLALVELNRDKMRPAGSFVLHAETGQGAILFSQLLLVPGSDKSVRLYTRLLGNLGAAFDDGLLTRTKGDGQWSVDKVMALPHKPWMDAEAMKAYYTDPAFSLNNLGEGLYGWMQRKERCPADGTIRIRDHRGERWFLSCFVYLLDPACGEGDPSIGIRNGRLQVTTNAAYELYMNGCPVPEPEKHIALHAGINRLIAIVQGEPDEEELRFGIVFKNTDGSYMKHLQYRLTLDEVEPK